MTTERSVSILYAEDEPMARGILEQLIRHKFPGIALFVAENGEQGIALFEEHRPELILTDIKMPIVDGYEMTRFIRTVDPDAYVIALTAYHDAEWDIRRKEIGFNVCLSKPVEFKVLLDVVDTAIASIKDAASAVKSLS